MEAKTKATMIKRKIKSVFLCLVGLFLIQVPTLGQDILDAPAPEISDEVPGDPTVFVQVRALDKITARITEISLPLNEEKKFGTLIIKARYCRSRPPEETPESFAYLEIDDVKEKTVRARVFEGWMLASSPAISALEHPVYDVWIIGCKTSAPIE